MAPLFLKIIESGDFYARIGPTICFVKRKFVVVSQTFVWQLFSQNLSDIRSDIYSKLPPPKDCRFAHSKNPHRRPMGGESYVKIPGTGISKDFYCRVWSLFGDNFFL
jgi:hypothetical protein